MQNKRPLYVYLVAVVVVWAVVLWVARLFNSGAHFTEILLVCGGYMIGMLAMYIAVHFYRY